MNTQTDDLPRRIGGWALGTMTVGIVIGSGIFRSPSEVAALLLQPELVILAWVAGGLITLCLAVSLAEMASMFPRAGGLYAYLEEAFGRRIAFLFGWTFLLINPANWAAVALIFSGYLVALLPSAAGLERWVACGAILAVGIVNTLSLRWATRFNGLFTVVKGAALLGIAAGILLLGMPGAANAGGGAAPGMGHWGLALVAVLWPFEGVAGAAALVGEVKNPHRNIPLGLIGGTAVITVIYLAVNLALLKALPVETIASSPFVAADAAEASLGAGAAGLIALAAIVATFGALIAGATCDPRVLFAMAKDRTFFAGVGHVNRRFETPDVAILLSTLLALVYVSVRTFEELAAQFVLGMWVFYVLAVIGLIRLRRTRPDAPRPYRVPLYPVLPIVFIVAGSWLLLSGFLEIPVTSFINLGFILLGLPIYHFWSRHADATAARPKRVPDNS